MLYICVYICIQTCQHPGYHCRYTAPSINTKISSKCEYRAYFRLMNFQKKSDLYNHEFQTICATRYNATIATTTVGGKKRWPFSAQHSANHSDLAKCYIKTLHKDKCSGYWRQHSKICVHAHAKRLMWLSRQSYPFIDLGPKTQKHISLSNCLTENCKLSMLKTAQSGSIKVLCLQRFPHRHFNCIKLWLRNEAGPAVHILCKYKPFKHKIIKIRGNKGNFYFAPRSGSFFNYVIKDSFKKFKNNKTTLETSKKSVRNNLTPSGRRNQAIH